MADHWFRLYDKIVHDIKVQALPGPLFKTWINILCIVSDNGGCLPALNAIAFALRVDEGAAFASLNALRKAGLLDTGEGGAVVPHNWKARQYIKDDEAPTEGSGTASAIKSRKHREKVKREKIEMQQAAQQGSTPVAQPGSQPGAKGSETGSALPPYTETETDTDQIRSDAETERTREVALASWPADYAEKFWARYPNKVGKADALKKLAKAASKVEWTVLMDGLERYIVKTDDRPWCNPATWIFQCRWADEPATVSPNNGKAKTTGGSIIDALREQAAFFDERADAERAAIDGDEAGSPDVLRLPAE